MKGITIEIGGKEYNLRFTRFTAQDLPLDDLTQDGGDSRISKMIAASNEILVTSFKANHPELTRQDVMDLIVQYDDEHEEDGENSTSLIEPLTEGMMSFFTTPEQPNTKAKHPALKKK